ncbi:MAG: HD domain-containing protein [Anaerolineales bacterium]|nr:HD domain-containing protein [Anaerolineales bacterium]
MTRDEALYLIPYFVSLAITTGVLVFAWQRRRSPGALAFSWYAFGQSLWIVGFIFELLSKGLANKIFWDGLQWFATLFLIISLPVFVVQFTDQKIPRRKEFFLASLVIPLLFTILLATDFLHHWIYKNAHLIPGSPFTELFYDFTPVIYVFALYGYALTFWGFYILLRRIIRPHNLYRAQVTLISLGFLIPTVGTIFSLFNIHIAPQRDATPFTAAIGNLIIAWGLFRFRIFEVAPIGRDQVFEAMVEPVVILDNQHIVVDINSSMLALLGKNANDVIGQPAKIIFDDFPIPIKMYTHVSYARAEASFNIGSKKIHYELTVWPVYNSNKRMMGRIYISHDITAMKELEYELRNLNAKLEDRVHARTRELADAYDTMLEGFARALELRDKETEGHSRRVTENTIKIAQKMGIDGDELEEIRSGSILHDIGKISIPDEILHKPGKLTVEERAIVQKHPETAYKLLSPITFLNKAIEIPYSHHEKWDGTGYPQGLKGKRIPLSARIFAVADVWDALSYDRPYNKAWPREKIIQYLINESGKHFDPEVVNIFLELVEKGEI